MLEQSKKLMTRTFTTMFLLIFSHSMKIEAGTDYRWTTPADTVMSTATNWTPNLTGTSLPSDTLYIDNETTLPILSVAMSALELNFTLNSSVTVNPNGVLTIGSGGIDAAATQNGIINIPGGIVTNAGHTAATNKVTYNLTSQGALTLTGGGQTSTGTSHINLIDNTPSILTVSTFNATVNSLNSIGESNLIVLNKNLTLDDVNTSLIAGTISGAGSLTKSGTGDLTISHANTYSGGTTITGSGEIKISADSNLGNTNGNLTLNTGTLTTTASTIARNITFAGLDNTIHVPFLSYTDFTGSLTGTGGFTLKGLGFMRISSLSAANTYSGVTTISNEGSRLIGGSFNFPTNAAFNIEGGFFPGTLNFLQTQDGTFGGTFVGEGVITTLGSTHQLSLTADNSAFAGTTKIPDGALKMEVGSFLGGNVELRGGILSGVGTIGTFHSGLVSVLEGIIHPGLSPGKLYVAGDYLQIAGTLAISVSGMDTLPGVNNSELVVAGEAVITPFANVNVIVDNGLFSLTDTYTILTSNTLVGRYAENVTAINSATGDLLVIQPVLDYDRYNVYLDFITPFLQIAANDNQLHVGEQITSISAPNGDELALITTLETSSVSEIQNYLDEMSGSQYAQLLSATETTTHQFINRLYDPIRAILTTFPCDDHFDCCDDHLEIWGTGSGGRSFLSDSHNAKGLKASQFQLTAGSHIQVNRCLTIGIAGSYENAHFNFNRGGSNKSHSALAALYVASRHRSYYVFADLVGGMTHNKLKRSFTIDSLTAVEKGNPKAFQSALYLEGGLNFHPAWFILQPFLGLETGYYYYGRFTESNSGNTDLFDLHFEHRSYVTYNSRLGFHLTTDPSNCGWTFALDCAWKCLWNSFHYYRTTEFTTFGDEFRLQGSDLTSNAIEATFNYTQKISGNWSFYTTANVEASHNATAYNFIGGITASW